MENEKVEPPALDIQKLEHILTNFEDTLRELHEVISSFYGEYQTDREEMFEKLENLNLEGTGIEIEEGL